MTGRQSEFPEKRKLTLYIVSANNLTVINDNLAVTTGTAALPIKLSNNTGYNPLGLTSAPPPVTGVAYTNNTGVDQYVYLKGKAGGVSVDRASSTTPPASVGATLSVYLVSAGGAISISGAPTPSGWTWLGN